ncbi:MAG TPA: YraN family protein [Solirubrobacteraceae bacterium]|nr:YraN family protein [Solirubrobacteraceae bacterium]
MPRAASDDAATPDRVPAASGERDRPLRPPDPRRGLGALGERLAAEHLERRGFVIVERNHRTARGEIDLIAHDGRTLVFVEVKTRRAGSGPPLESVGPRKQRRVRRLAAQWLSETASRPRFRELRLDAIGVVVDSDGRLKSLEHLEGAM